MSIFLLTVLAVYSSVHVYVFYKAHHAFDFGTGAKTALGILMAAMILAPLLVRRLEQSGHESLAYLNAQAGYLWMGFIFIFFSISLATDLGILLLRTLEKLPFLKSNPGMPSARATFLAVLACTICVGVWACMEARNIRTEHLRLTSGKLPPDIKNLRIVQISDVHLGIINRENQLDTLLAAVKAAQPDILVSTGDLVDGQIDNLSKLSRTLAAMNPRYGKFAVMGNHEYYAGIKQSLDFTTICGFTVLRGQAYCIPGLINIAGMDDPAGKHFGRYQSVDEEELLKSLPERFTLLLRHQPHIREDTLNHFDLQLSGHTHKGQIFPFSLVVKAFFSRYAGLYRLSKKSYLYVSRGTGTWGPPMRFLAPPEICIIDIQNNNAAY